MRKVLCLLSVVLSLFACDEVDDFGQRLPENIMQGEVLSVSDLSYEELNSLVADEGLREQMRTEGGLLLQPLSGNISAESFDFMEIYYSDVFSALPPATNGTASSTDLTGQESFYDGAGIHEDRVYFNWHRESQRYQLPGTTIYFKVALGLYDDEESGWPGFVDDCTDFSTTSYGYSDVKSYTYPDAPLLTDFEVYGGDVLQANFQVLAEGDIASQVVRRGVCYSTTNPLPDVNDATAVASPDYNESAYATVYVPVESGTYFVRAFVQGAGGDIAYSPVKQVACEGLVVNVHPLKVSYVVDYGWNELEQYLSSLGVSSDNRRGTRLNGGLLIEATADIEGAYTRTEFELNISYSEDDLWDDPKNYQFYWTVAENEGRRLVAFHPEFYYSKDYYADKDTYYYQYALEVWGDTGGTTLKKSN